MSQRIKRHAFILSACAGLLAGCAPGDDTDDYASEDQRILAQQAGHDASVGSAQDGGANAHDAGDHVEHDAGTHAGPDAGMSAGHDGGMQGGHETGGHTGAVEQCRTTHPLYRAGLTQKVGNFTIELVSASPAPPRQQVPNDWVIRILDAAGQPVTGAKLENADTFMAVHAHGGAFDPFVEPGAGPGEWKLLDLDFTMRGPWEVNFDLTPAGAARPTLVTFNICVE